MSNDVAALCPFCMRILPTEHLVALEPTTIPCECGREVTATKIQTDPVYFTQASE